MTDWVGGEREWRFRITQGRLGFWWWSPSGHGSINVSGGGLSALPRRSRRACEAAASKWAAKQRQAEGRVSEFSA